jgi:hypothetical protein
VDALDVFYRGVEAAHARYVAHLVAQLDRIWAGDARHAGLMQGVRQGLAQQQPLLDRLFAVRRDTIAVSRELLAHAAECAPHLEDGMLAFADEADVERFNELVARLQDVAAGEQALLQQMAGGLQDIAPARPW